MRDAPSPRAPGYEQCLRLAESGQHEKARAAYRAYLARHADDGRALNDLGALCWAAGEFEESAAYLRQAAARLGPERGQALWNLAEVCLAADRPADTLALFDELAAEEVLAPDLADRTAAAFANRDDRAGAVEALLWSLRLAPGRDIIRAALRAVKAARPKVAFVLGQFDAKFIGDIFRHVGRRFEVRLCLPKSNAELADALRWCDIAWFEWCAETVVAASRMPKTCRSIVRLHRFEAYRPWPAQVNWDAIDVLVSVGNPVTMEYLKARVPDLERRTRIEMIPNGVDLAKFAFVDRPRGKNLAYVGYLKQEKNPMLLLQCFHRLRQADPEYRLFFAGSFVEHDPLQRYMHEMVGELGLSEAVRFDGWQNDVAAWLRDKHYLVSASLVEGHPVGVLEGMARGLKPVVHTFPGCRTFFPDEFLYRTVDEFCERILAGPYEPRAYRDFVAERFGLSKQLARVEALLAELEKQVPARTNAERGTWNAERQTRSAPRLTARPRQVPGSDFRVPSCRGRAGSERAIGGPGPSPGQTAAETRPSALRPGYAMAVWRITHRCNFRCAYCFGRDPAPEARGPARLDVYERLDDLIGRFAAAGRDWTFRFTGGEPLLYPHFPEICGALAEKFHIYLDTNLSVPVGPVLEAVPPDRMEQVFAACHIQERLARGNLEVFLANLRLLKEGGYPVAVNYVMYPPVIGRFEQDLEFFRARGFGLEPKSFKGVYGGRRYPRSYTPEERALIRRHAPHDRFAVEVPDYRGWRCNAGHKLVRILEDGTVVRCVSDKTVLGNVFEGFDLFEGPRACPATRCPCYDARILFDGLPDPSRAAREDGPCAAAPCPAAAGEGPT